MQAEPKDVPRPGLCCSRQAEMLFVTCLSPPYQQQTLRVHDTRQPET